LIVDGLTVMSGTNSVEDVIDDDALRDALTEDPTAVEKLFAAFGDTTTSKISYKSKTESKRRSATGPIPATDCSRARRTPSTAPSRS
jgi:flagellar capping protein FliD